MSPWDKPMRLPGALCLAIPAFRTWGCLPHHRSVLAWGQERLNFPFHIGPVIENSHETAATGFPFVELPGGLRRRRVGRFPERGTSPHVHYSSR